MKRSFQSSSPPSSPNSSSQISDELEPAPKRPRIFVSSPTPPPEHIDDSDDEEIIVDEPARLSPVSTAADSLSDVEVELEIDDDDDIIEIEEQGLDLLSEQNDGAFIVVSDSDSDSDDDDDDDQGIDVTDDMIAPVPSVADQSISSSDSTDVEIVHEELTLMDDEEQPASPLNDDNDLASAELISSEDLGELIDLTDDEPSPASILSNRKLSVDVQQCPICLETLSYLQRTGVYLIITPCRHVMCTSCSRQLLATSSRCPLCRENVNSTTLMPYCILT